MLPECIGQPPEGFLGLIALAGRHICRLERTAGDGQPLAGRVLIAPDADQSASRAAATPQR